ncbi:ATP-binding protein [Acanthopleuribacter pedis]|uniref:ATP-binding protein n=1 Tax=Acanthopleuribacter pedis TaxID=442870 RepID=A0A8J7Q565_9BACT|nr:ATP-binding protein [Acanthopleuribacter pedis]MBO1318327.1 ATP-binding protein [Acanthopleuribacter pedis]
MKKAKDVFVAGGLPTFTYIPRENRHLESALEDYLDQPFKILSITGPTKSGKTVLTRKRLPKKDSIWVTGGQFQNMDEFWEQVLNKVNVFNSVTASTTDSDSVTTGRNLNAGLGTPVVSAGVKSNHQVTNGTSSTNSKTRDYSYSTLAINYLEEHKIPLVIDDFHYVDQDLQLQIVRILKELIFEGCPVIFIAIPHRAYDVIKIEKEMTGRVKQLSVPTWSEEELIEIARKGFKELNLVVVDKMLERLSRESHGSPHIMQDFCHSICKINNYREAPTQEQSIPHLADWDSFFKSKASDMGKVTFQRLAQGPRPRKDRKQRLLKDGNTCDIYKAILLAIAEAGPKSVLDYEEIRTGLKNVLNEQIPNIREISRVLDSMTNIAKEELEGEAVLEWNKSEGKLHLIDPFLSYYLKWGEG